jgi:hypothetical protein
MIDNTSLKPDIRHATPTSMAIVAGLALIAVIACVVSGSPGYALGSKKQGPPNMVSALGSAATSSATGR